MTLPAKLVNWDIMTLNELAEDSAHNSLTCISPVLYRVAALHRRHQLETDADVLTHAVSRSSEIPSPRRHLTVFMRSYEHCPKCGWADTRRVKTGSVLARIVKLFGFRQYRCRGCKVSFYRRHNSFTDAEMNVLSTMPEAQVNKVSD